MPDMGVIPNPKMVFISPISCIIDYLFSQFLQGWHDITHPGKPTP